MWRWLFSPLASNGRRTICLALALLLTSPLHRVAESESLQSLQETFQNPPADARPLMRWWWFGPAVTMRELKIELEAMQKAGIGGVEIQPVYPLMLDDPVKGIRNLKYLSPEFLNAVTFANQTARSLGLRVDITLGSGWPYGGPKTTLALAAGKLRAVALPVTTAANAPPPLADGESFIAAFLVNGTPKSFDPSSAKPLDPTATTIPAGSSPQTALPACARLHCPQR